MGIHRRNGDWSEVILENAVLQMTHIRFFGLGYAAEQAIHFFKKAQKAGYARKPSCGDGFGDQK